MSILQQLLDAWGHDPATERELVELIDAVVTPAIRAGVADWHAPTDLAADVQQEFWVWLIERDLRPLRVLRAEKSNVMRSYLQVVARNFTNRRLDRWSRERRRESAAVKAHPPPNPLGGTEADIDAAMAEFNAELTDRERSLLGRLLREFAAELAERDTSASAAERSVGCRPKWRLHKEIQRLYGKMRDILRG